jgi:hypothetical protein
MSKARQINFEQAVYDAFGQVKDFTLAMRIARYFYEKSEKDTIAIIESRLSELLGDAQPTPILRHELQDLIKKIEEEEQ